MPPINFGLLNRQLNKEHDPQFKYNTVRGGSDVGGKVEVINSASAAFRNFVKEKSLYLKGLDPFALNRTMVTSTDG